MPVYKDYFTQKSPGYQGEQIRKCSSVSQPEAGLITHNHPGLCSTLSAFIQEKPGLFAQHEPGLRTGLVLSIPAPSVGPAAVCLHRSRTLPKPDWSLSIFPGPTTSQTLEGSGLPGIASAS